MTTGWPPGLLQDDCRKLSKWFASRPEARYLVRRNLMTDCTPAQARELADTPLHKSIEPLRNAVRSLANQVEALTADRDSWANQVSDRIDDALKFAAERDALKADAARYHWLKAQDNDNFCFAIVKNPHFDCYASGELDAAIDHAMKDPK